VVPRAVGIEFLTNLHVLSIYLVLGIGADDLFVFYDAWMQAVRMQPALCSPPPSMPTA
jgi:hypothetical protein